MRWAELKTKAPSPRSPPSLLRCCLLMFLLNMSGPILLGRQLIVRWRKDCYLCRVSLVMLMIYQVQDHYCLRSKLILNWYFKDNSEGPWGGRQMPSETPGHHTWSPYCLSSQTEGTFLRAWSSTVGRVSASLLTVTTRLLPLFVCIVVKY